MDDLVSRVLGGGLRERWGGRLEPVRAWVGEREDSAELGAFFSFCLRRDRQRALERGCSLEALRLLEEDGCDVEDTVSESRAAAAFVSSRLASLADEARRFLPPEP